KLKFPSTFGKSSIALSPQCCNGIGHDICVQAIKYIQQAKDRKLKEHGNTKDTHVKFKPLVKKKAKGKKSQEKFDLDLSVDEDYSDDGDGDVSTKLQNPKSLGKSLGMFIGESKNNSKMGISFEKFIQDLE
nr:hypothetical protein [Tanacetum cinerariifolium]GEX80915.1 hypothetical protein [Tanacetum cinerariifolium]